MDVAPTLGVNHVYLVLWFFFFFSSFCSVIFLSFAEYLNDKKRPIDEYMNE